MDQLDEQYENGFTEGYEWGKYVMSALDDREPFWIAASLSTWEPCVTQFPYVISEILKPLLPRYLKSIAPMLATPTGRVQEKRFPRQPMRHTTRRGSAQPLDLCASFGSHHQ